MDQSASRTAGTFVGALVAQGFAAAVAVWCAWYITHIPWLNLSEQARLPALVLVWLGMCIWAGAAAPRTPALAGTGAGLIAALVGFLLLGSKLADAPTGASASSGLRPDAPLMAAGFVAFGAAIGLIGGAIGGLVHRSGRETDWLARFGLVTAASVAPLVFIGGLVTSTNSGMAVPDWPNTYGSNMFLYPLGPRVSPAVFFEHSHRLFGTLVGLTSLVLMTWTLVARNRRWVKAVAIGVFVLVVLQGVLGGIRVRMGSTDAHRDLRAFAMAHGVLAQITFGTAIALALFLSPTFKQSAAAFRRPEEIPGLRRLRFFTTALLHSTLLQLLLGAMYRHFRDSHSMWTHAGFSIVVLVFALMAGFAASALPDDRAGIGRIIRRCGAWLVGIVIVQFLLGWATFSLGGSGLRADSPGQALLRTCHQANGALLVAMAVAAFLWTRRLVAVTAGRASGPRRAPVA